ncbi:hypothetical protein ACS0VU_09320 [Aliiroseovarius sp. KMU-71]|uniref:hypothetical protein n=1 Tax=Aliiroseovarius sp. KMU-71 TaxID=3453123 RepID=UPI003F4606DF
MFKNPISAAITFSLIATTALAEDKETWVTPQNLKSISVEILDRASDGCWTNLGEVKTYTEDKLSLRGFNIVEHVEDRPQNMDEGVVRVSVHSERTQNGCYGNIFISLISILRWKEEYFYAQLGGSQKYIFTGHSNANQLMLSQAKTFAESWPY